MKKVSWTDEIKIHLHQSDGSSKVWRLKRSIFDPRLFDYKHKTVECKIKSIKKVFVPNIIELTGYFQSVQIYTLVKIKIWNL